MLQRPVYINATSSFFPNEPIPNERMESVLGQVNGRSSRARSIVLKSNKITRRFYAINPQTRKPTHTNAQMTAMAITQIFAEHSDLDLREVQLLCCGTSSPDLLVPAHGQMVQGELPDLQCEVISTSGVCCSSMAALKMAFLSVASGDADKALVTGSETASKFMRGEFLESECERKLEELEKNPVVAFEHDFLRWMLSDAAASLYLSQKAPDGKLNLRINWIEGRSYANRTKVCMFAGGHRQEDGTVTAWKDLRLGDVPADQDFAMNFRQDVRQLREQVTHFTIEEPLSEIKKRRGLRPGDYAWLLPHYSSDFFRQALIDSLNKVDFVIPFERWFTSLYDYGNVGSASLFVFLDHLIRQKDLKRGEKILCYVPESARFSVYWAELEVV